MKTIIYKLEYDPFRKGFQIISDYNDVVTSVLFWKLKSEKYTCGLSDINI